jgi:hypothetical protein
MSVTIKSLSTELSLIAILDSFAVSTSNESTSNDTLMYLSEIVRLIISQSTLLEFLLGHLRILNICLKWKLFKVCYGALE